MCLFRAHGGPGYLSNKKIPIPFLKPNFWKLQDDSKYVSARIEREEKVILVSKMAVDCAADCHLYALVKTLSILGPPHMIGRGKLLDAVLTCKKWS